MNSRKVDRALYGPSWAEVFLGALLSFVIGVALAAALLMLKPVKKVAKLPEEPVEGVVYYIEGGQNFSASQTADAKIEQLKTGTSISLTEEELNALATSILQPSAEPGTIAPAKPTPNFRIIDDRIQISYPATIELYGFTEKIQVVARGDFVRTAEGLRFQPDEMSIGSLVADRLPYVKEFVLDKLIAWQAPSTDLVDLWKRLSDASIADNKLDLSM